MRGVIAAALALLALAAFLTFAPLAGPFLVVADPLPASADAVVVLAGSLRARSLEAARLYKAGIAPRVVVTRELLPPGTTALREAGVELPDSDALTRSALAGLGVPPRAIVTLRRRAHSTASEARTIARWACAHDYDRLVVVTSPSHTRRARLVLSRALGPDDSFAGDRWYRVRRDAKEVLSEWQKLAHHWLRERWSIEPCGGLRRRPQG
jgi:uncharacterized SAM-binding protein YcdF (DUF218 family)